MEGQTNTNTYLGSKLNKLNINAYVRYKIVSKFVAKLIKYNIHDAVQGHTDVFRT